MISRISDWVYEYYLEVFVICAVIITPTIVIAVVIHLTSKT